MSIARRLAALGFGRQLYTFTGGILPAGIGFTRASAGWRFNAAGLLVSEATNVARFQYDPATLVSRGLLIEDAATNLLAKSEKFDDASWSKTRSSISADGALAPDGTTTMDKLVEDSTATSSHLTGKNASFTTGTTYVVSVFAKADTRSWIYLRCITTGNPTVWFNLGAGAVGTSSGGATGFITDLGGGIYRCTMIFTSLSTGAATWQVFLTTGDGTSTYSGDGTSGLFIWGAQCQVGDAITSYIQTDAATAARASDVALITNPAILGDQCYALKARTPRKLTGGAVNVLLQIDDGTNNNTRRIVYGTDGRIHVIATSGGVDQCDLDLGAVAANTDFGVAARFAENNFAASLNGGAVVVDSAGVNPTGLTTARLGRRSDGYAWNSTIRSLESRRQASDGDLRALAA